MFEKPHQLKILLRRNLLLKRRNYSRTLAELIIPLIIIPLYSIDSIIVKLNVRSVNNEPSVSFPHTAFDYPHKGKVILGAPLGAGNTNQWLMNKTAHALNITVDPPYLMFKDWKEMQNYWVKNHKKVAAGITFGDLMDSLDPSQASSQFGELYDGFQEMAKKAFFVYKIRMLQNKEVPDTREFIPAVSDKDCGSPDRNKTAEGFLKHCKPNMYISSGYAHIQRAVETAYFEQKLKYPPPKLELYYQMLGNPFKNVSDEKLMMQQLGFNVEGLISVFIFVLVFNSLVVLLVNEKERKILMTMQTMGLETWTWYLAWALVYIPIFIFYSFVLSFGWLIFDKVDISIVPMTFLILFLYSLTLIPLAFCALAGFEKVRSASGLTSILYLVFATGGIILSATLKDKKVSTLLGFFSPAAAGVGIFQLLDRDPFYPPSLAVAQVIADFVIYSLLAWFLMYVYPLDEERRSCFGGTNKHGEVNEAVDMTDLSFEPVSSDLSPSIRLTDMRKTFNIKKGSKKAVQGVTLDIYPGQITCILGHNGAGKTTLINMMIGRLEADSGQSFVLGHTPQERRALRGKTGICAQEDTIFPELTVMEHLTFAAELKDIPAEDIEKQCLHWTKRLGLTDQENQRANELSGGEKRKLCVAIALLGNPQLLILDEPTGGVDAFSRKVLWDVLKSECAGKTVLLTTHYMVEADKLADRKALMHEGRIVCCGSSAFMRQRFELGFVLTVSVDSRMDPAALVSEVRQFVPEATISTCSHSEVSFDLPLNSKSQFSALLAALEAAKPSGVIAYGVAEKTLDEMFFKLQDHVDVNEIKMIENEVAPIDSDRSLKRLLVPPRFSTMDCWIALMKLKFTCMLKRWTYWLAMTVVPVVVLAGFILFFRVFILDKLEVKMKQAFEMIEKGGLPFLINYYSRPLSNITEYRDLVGSGESDMNLAVMNVQPPFLLMYNSSDHIQKMGGGLDRALSFFQTVTRAKYHESLAVYAGYKIGLKVDENKVTLLYSPEAIHAIPFLLSQISFGLPMRTDVPGNEMTIYFPFSWPWPTADESTLLNLGMMPFFIFFCSVLVTRVQNFGIEPVREREMGTRLQLRTSGVTPILYWTATAAFDWCQVMVFVILLLVCGVVILKISSAGFIVVFLLVAAITLVGALLGIYVFGMFFKKHEAFSVIAYMVTLFACLGPFIAVIGLGAAAKNEASFILHCIASAISPFYGTAGGTYFAMRAQFRSLTSVVMHEPELAEFFAWEHGVSFTLFCSVVHIVLLLIALRIMEPRCGELWPISGSTPAVKPSDDLAGDTVTQEAEESLRLRLNPEVTQPACLASRVSKVFREGFGKPNKVAVNDVSFHVDNGEVFGLLGPNGAGKSTLFKMLSAELAPSGGEMFIHNERVQRGSSSLDDVLELCPQTDPLWESLTVAEHLHHYCALIGYLPEDGADIADALIDLLLLKEHKDTKAKSLSGGTKRKLSFCIAVLAGRQNALFDEPTTGVDPVSKRATWGIIRDLFDGSQGSAILTSHSMEEVEALCSKVAIIVNGSLRAYGSTQTLKSILGQQYTLEVKTEAEFNIKSLFPSAELFEHFSVYWRYEVAFADVPNLAAAFALLEKSKLNGDISDYSFSQPSLEQVFLQLAKEQYEGPVALTKDFKII